MCAAVTSLIRSLPSVSLSDTTPRSIASPHLYSHRLQPSRSAWKTQMLRGPSLIRRVSKTSICQYPQHHGRSCDGAWRRVNLRSTNCTIRRSASRTLVRVSSRRLFPFFFLMTSTLERFGLATVQIHLRRAGRRAQIQERGGARSSTRRQCALIPCSLCRY